MPSDSDITPPGNNPRRPPRDGSLPTARRVAEFGRVPQGQGAPSGAPGRQPPPGTGARPGGTSTRIPAIGEGSDQPILRNPYVLAGIAVGAAIFLAIVFVVAFGSSGSGSADGEDTPGLIIDPLTPGPVRGVAARSVASATVREGPGLDYLAIGELSRNLDVEVVGRNEEANWFNIYFPPNSSLRGWVPVTALRLPSNSGGIPVVSITPIPRPTIVQPTLPPEPTASITPTPTVTVTGTPEGGSDLVASAVPGTCAVGSRLIVNVRNQGPAPLTSRAISILVQAIDGSQRALATQTATIPPGGQVDIDTGYVVQERVVATVDPLQTIGDPNMSNNRVDCVVSVLPTVPGLSPTRTSTSAVPPAFATPTRTPLP